MEISNLYLAEEYKNKIISLLYENDNFIKLINPKPSACPYLDIKDVLDGGEWVIEGKKWEEMGYVFDYDFTDDTLSEERTFVFVDTDIDTVRDNMFTDFNLCIFVFTAKNLVRLNSSSDPTSKDVKDMGYFSSNTRGNRIGALCDCIDRILNGSDKLNGIGNVRPAPKDHVLFYAPNTNYYGKCLKYNITNYNPGGDECGN